MWPSRGARPREGHAAFHAEFALTARSLEVHVLRGDILESRHRVHAVVSGADGATPVVFGDPEAASFWRSALKPFQALSLVEDGAASAFGFGSEELALACASHGGLASHTERVRAMLRAAGLDDDALHCGPHPPYDSDAATAIECAGGRPGKLHNNCSGKHAAMLALAVHHGWSVAGYWRFEHPVQRRVREGLAQWIDGLVDELSWETDGCGLPTPFLPLHDMARAFARLGRRAAEGDRGPAAVVGAMTEHPDLTSSPGREPLRLMEASSGRLMAKEGAEGILCVAAPADGWGMALKIEDGARRAVGPAAVSALTELGLLTAAEVEALASLAEPILLGTTGEVVGALRGVRPDTRPGAGPR